MRVPKGSTLTQAVLTLTFNTYMAGNMIISSHTEGGLHFMLFLQARAMSFEGTDCCMMPLPTGWIPYYMHDNVQIIATK